MVPAKDPILTNFLYSETRLNASLLTQFITGHNFLRYHLSLTKPGTDKTCRLCGDGTEDSWHLLARCGRLAMRSYETFMSNDLQKLPHPKLVLKYIRETQIVSLMEPPQDEEEDQREGDDSLRMADPDSEG